MEKNNVKYFDLHGNPCGYMVTTVTVTVCTALCTSLEKVEWLRIGEDAAVVEGDLELGVLRVEVVLQAVEVAAALPLAHRQVVEQVVAAGFGTRGGHLVLRENPLQTADGELPHVLDGVGPLLASPDWVRDCCDGLPPSWGDERGAFHNNVHARETAHGTNVDDVVLGLAVAEPGGHEVFQTVHGGRCHGGFLVGLGDAQVECGETLVLARDVDARLQVGMVDGKALYDFHNTSLIRCFCRLWCKVTNKIRNFAIKDGEVTTLGIKKELILFVLLSFFRNFAAKLQNYRYEKFESMAARRCGSGNVCRDWLLVFLSC